MFTHYNPALNFWGHVMTLACAAIIIEMLIYYFFFS